MSNSMSGELLKRITAANGKDNERITVSLDRRLLAVLEKYRKRDSGNGRRSRRQSLGEVAGELIVAADELLEQRAGASHAEHESSAAME